MCARVYVHGLARRDARGARTCLRYACITLRRASFSGVPLGSAHEGKASYVRVRPAPLRVYQANAKKWADVSPGAVSVLGHPRVHPVAPMYQACARVCNTYWVSGGSSLLSSCFLCVSVTVKICPDRFLFRTPPNRRSRAVAFLIHEILPRPGCRS